MIWAGKSLDEWLSLPSSAAPVILLIMYHRRYFPPITFRQKFNPERSPSPPFNSITFHKIFDIDADLATGLEEVDVNSGPSSSLSDKHTFTLHGPQHTVCRRRQPPRLIQLATRS